MKSVSLHYPTFSLSLLQKSGQIFLIVILLLTVSLMIFPLSSALLDFLLSLNMVGSFLILMVSILTNDVLKFSSLSSLLLLTTLFRLGLNMASTRLILSQGHAGYLVDTFAQMIVGHQLAVGVILFIILMIIQFIVISKGAERIAEVAARFTLDALPGKQMSIDADLRSGLISSQEAQDKRLVLIHESKFYGALDGAMKFVKGDVIAGFIIVVINMIGGFAIGVLERDMSFAVAAQVYTKLTLGDALVAQIPSLITSLAAGLMVTRVQKNNVQNLGLQVSHELLAKPQPFFVVAILSVIFAFVPGFPTLFFFILALFLASLGFFIQHTQEEKNKKEYSSLHLPTLNKEFKTDDHLLQPFSLELAPNLYQDFLSSPLWYDCFDKILPRIRQELIKRTGVPFPELNMTVNEMQSHHHYVLKIFGVTVDAGSLFAKHDLLRNPLSQRLYEDHEIVHTYHGTPAVLIEKNKSLQLSQQGFILQAPEQLLLEHITQVMQKHAVHFIDMQQVQNMITRLEKNYAELVRESVPRLITLQKLTRVVQKLVEEQISLHDFRLILEIISHSHPEEKNEADLVELVRLGLRKQITFHHAGLEKSLDVIGLSADLELEIFNHLKKNHEGLQLSLAPEKIKNIIHQTQKILHNTSKKLVVITQIEIRRAVRKILEDDFPTLAVLAYEELESQVKIFQQAVIYKGEKNDKE